VFRGVNNISLDAKGRLAVPVRYRDYLVQHCNGEMVVTIDTEERCLLIYPRPEWEDLERKVGALPSFNPASRRVQRLLIGHATDIDLDGSGRILIPPPLRQYAQLEKKTVMLGQGNKLELWSEEHWTSRRDTWLNDQSNLELPPELENLSL
jgi:MraZ protein